MIESESNPAKTRCSENTYRNTSATRLISAIFSGRKPTRSASVSHPSHMSRENTMSQVGITVVVHTRHIPAARTEIIVYSPNAVIAKFLLASTFLISGK
jgi:hypothetical protein